ncbi:MAG: FAD-dependent oxidoreductase [Candidatus Falkowbacteria bacterium]|nr:FAD-dependent oxidoreductase [Candidatus Falkowbacteria bacterium]
MTYDYDLIIIGSGAAGLTASIYASRYKMKNLLIGDILGGTTTEAHKIHNWPGDPGITGFELTNKMSAHVKELGAEIMGDTVVEVAKQDNGFLIKTKSGKSLSAKKVLFTSGTKHRHLGVARENDLLGKGVGYCATCDGLFYQGRRVAMVGGGNSVISAALYLADVAEKVFVIVRGEALKGEPLWREELAKRPNVTIINNTNVVNLVGQEKLEALELDKEYNGSNVLAVDGMFVEIGLVPQTELFKVMGGETDALGYILVKADMSTNIPGVYAAGDSTNASNNFHQIVTACGEGAVAADAIYKSLSVSQ